MQAPGVGLEEVIAVVSGTLLTSMVAEQAGSSGNLRGSELAQALTKAASMAGGEVFQENTGISKETQELVISMASGVALKAIGAVCSRRRKLQPSGEGGQGEQQDQVKDEQSGRGPSEFEMKNI